MKHQIETRIIFQLVFIIEGWIDSSPGLGYNIQIDSDIWRLGDFTNVDDRMCCRQDVSILS